MDSEIAPIYEKLASVVSEEEFLRKVNEKMDKMGPLCDKKTIALLVASDLGVTDASQEPMKIADINENSSNVYIIGKVVSLFDTREFSRNDGTTGRVGNLIVADSSGSIRVTLWDELADQMTTGSIQAGKSYRVSGYVKEGYSGLEINVGRYGGIEEVDEEIQIELPSMKIADIKENDSDINLNAVILQVLDIRTFNKRTGGEGKVRNILVGDDSGKIRVTLWDEKAELDRSLHEGVSIEIINGYARVNNFNDEVEIQIGNHGVIRKADSEVLYKEQYTPISDIIPGESYSVRGFISGIGEVREFSRKDGGVGMVSNVYLSDDTGRIRVTLWDDMAEMAENVDIDTEMEVIDAYAKTGFNDEVELNTGRRSRVVFL
ncbi:replication factor A1 [Methanohalophilus levihalophilus]|uniref:OB-fold nucleic acid binding domain-containing protein n=1 Tax=Methanohalophilus levihalophilus TaxID=1431282 RepID=UPI001AE49270|nr:OB-fold nucleic acid binding domain-containing protein [Methanohalophilus levihalophilus]MBP2029935.1 replication factor A1 [Methanohalophilus levihalophilus]